MRLKVCSCGKHFLWFLAVNVVVSGYTAPTFAKPVGSNKAKSSAAKKPTKKPAGGANQVEGLNGKIGQVLFDGKWSFQVLDVQQVDTYTLKVLSSEQDYAMYHDVADEDSTLHTFTPKAGYTFIAIKCQVKSRQQNKVEQLDCYSDNPKTALTDFEANSYPPIVYDMQSKGAWTTKPLLPGSTANMTVLFAVPPDTKLKDLVFTLKNWSAHVGQNVRVSLKR